MTTQMIYIETEQLKRDGLQQNLPGFESKYHNIVDYILKITEDIWEKKDVEVINETYEKDILIHTGARKINGVEKVIGGTNDTLSSFPDRKMQGEAVIWSTDNNGDFYSSHRILSTATNQGSTVYGMSTGKKISFRTIADCKIANNKIYEEWLVRDNLYILLQLGFDPVEMAKKDVTYKENPMSISVNSPIEMEAQNISFPEGLVYSLITNVWKNKALAEIENYFSENSTLHAICNQDVRGVNNIEEYIQSILNSFKEVTINVDRITSNRKGNSTEIAARWYIRGRSTKSGIFGIDSADEVFVPIISHYNIENGKITDEWMVYDGFDALCQLYN
ncbi:ester cyclase [Gillisia sp. Q332]|uniref:nuclear transport factor 2 family protein n=1 Tax=Gillisia xinjiangensis TaxID=3384765 RepID=UPI00391DD450